MMCGSKSARCSSGPAAECSDSELLTMALVGECRGWAEETVLLVALA